MAKKKAKKEVEEQVETVAAPWEMYSDAPSGYGGEGLASGDRILIEIKDGDKRGEVEVKDAHEEIKTALREAGVSDFANSRIIFNQDEPADVYLTPEKKKEAKDEAMRMYREDTNYRAVIDAFLHYVIGRGLKFKADDENEKVQEHIAKFWKANKMDGRDAEIVRRYLTVGEIALRYFSEGPNGFDAKVLMVRLIHYWRIRGVIYDTEDLETPTEYLISVPSRRDKEGQILEWEDKEIPAEEIQFLKHGDVEEERGYPPFIQIHKVCRWFQDFLFNRVVLNRFRTAFVLFKEVDGDPGKVSSNANQHPDSKTKGKKGKLAKRMPKPGTVVTHNKSVKYTWMNPDTGAGDADKDIRRLLLSIAAGAQVPEFVLGDASNSNKASTLVAGTPFVRKVQFFQDFFGAFFSEMFERVIKQGIKTNAIPSKSTDTIIIESNMVMRGMRKLLNKIGLQESDHNGNLVKVTPIDTRTTVTIDWPQIIHEDESVLAKTLSTWQAMEIASDETLSTRAGFDWEVEKPRIDRQRKDRQDQDVIDRDEEIEAEDPAEKDDEE